MNIVTLDFETYFDDDYSLKKMTTEEYVRDPRFEVLGVGLRRNDGFAVFGHPTAVLHYIPSNSAVLCHHAQFDGLILSHYYGIRPALWLDTLSMARLVVGNHLRLGLDALAHHYGLEGKRIDYKSFKGKRRRDLTGEERKALADGCLHDVDLTWRLFEILMAEFPDEELAVIDLTIRMFTEAVLEGDVDLLAKVWINEEHHKDSLLRELAISRDDLQSSEIFAGLLRAEGVEPDLKCSPTNPAKSIYAFAKTDDFMKDLGDDDSRAGALARARLGVRSTISQTRAERLGWMASRGKLPVYLRYSGAHTGRWAGGDNLNWQNLPRGSDLRRAIKAPEGGALVVLDLAQIECRMLNTLAGEQDVVDAFRTGRDIYSEGASAFYGRTITRDDPLERHLGKTVELGCGFGMGPAKLRATLRRGALGGPPIDLDEHQANSAIQVYRRSHPNVVAYWRAAEGMIHRLANGESCDWGPTHVEGGRIYLPNGAWLNYRTLEYDQEWQAWKIKSRQGWVKLYGGKLVENVVQALARVVLSQAMLRIANLGYKIATCTHDEIVVALDKSMRSEHVGFEHHYEICQVEMERPPAWLPDLPVKADGGISERYEK